VIDGTVTKFIEAYTLEPVEIVRLAQETRRLAAEHAWLETAAGIEVAVRQVLLQGRYSHTFHAYAASLVVLERLPEAVRRFLDVEGQGLGRILNDQSMETRREILWYGRETAKELPEEVRRRADGEFVSRSYRIIAGGRPLMLIHEKFPAVMDKSPAHH
jgi:chorismate-pyruvate lyase